MVSPSSKASHCFAYSAAKSRSLWPMSNHGMVQSLPLVVPLVAFGNLRAFESECQSDVVSFVGLCRSKAIH